MRFYVVICWYVSAWCRGVLTWKKIGHSVRVWVFPCVLSQPHSRLSLSLSGKTNNPILLKVEPVAYSMTRNVSRLLIERGIISMLMLLIVISMCTVDLRHTTLQWFSMFCKLFVGERRRVQSLWNTPLILYKWKIDVLFRHFQESGILSWSFRY